MNQAVRITHRLLGKVRQGRLQRPRKDVTAKSQTTVRSGACVTRPSGGAWRRWSGRFARHVSVLVPATYFPAEEGGGWATKLSFFGLIRSAGGTTAERDVPRTSFWLRASSSGCPVLVGVLSVRQHARDLALVPRCDGGPSRNDK